MIKLTEIDVGFEDLFSQELSWIYGLGKQLLQLNEKVMIAQGLCKISARTVTLPSVFYTLNPNLQLSGLFVSDFCC